MKHPKLEGLQPHFREKVEQMLAMLDGIGFTYVLLEGLRTNKVQRAYFAQGREPLHVVNEYRRIAGLGPITEAANKNTITDCDGDKVKSKHQGGLAVDIVPTIKGKLLWDTTSPNAQALWQQLGTTAEAVDLEWGGNWGKTQAKLGWDCPHIEWREAK